jgi:ribosome recycling factor
VCCSSNFEQEVNQGESRVRSIQREVNEQLCKLAEEEVPLDKVRDAETVLQQYTGQHLATLEEILQKQKMDQLQYA